MRRMYRSLAGVALFAVAALAAATAARADLSGWPSSMRIDVTGYDRDEALDNFPVLVTLSNGLQGFYYADMNSPSDGADLRFSVDGVNELNYSLDEWNTNGVSLVWVQVPALTNNLSFFAYWGASASLPAYTTNGAAWSNGYAAVWHLGETVTAGATNGLHADATANANTGTQKKNGWTNGIIGRAQNFDRTATINCGNKSSLRPTNITISAWVMPRNITYTTYLEIYRKEDGNDRHLFSFQNTGTILSFGMGAPAGDYNEQDVSISPGNYTGAWHHLVCTYNGSVKKIYRDGVEIGSAADSGSLNTAGTANGYIGSYLGTGEFFDGLIDQMEISRVGRSSNWVWASYLQVASNQSFLTYTASAGINNLPATNITTSSAWLNGYLTPGWDDDANVTVAVYWGDVDGGSPTSRLWKATNIWSQGVWAEGSYPTFQATALTADKFYYYRYAAWDAGRTNWPGSSSYFLAGQVSVSAPDSLANESGDTGTFRISRGATATNEALTVYYTIGGSAVPGTHYTLSPAGTSLVLPAGVASADITVSPLVDNTSASDTTVTLQLLPGLYALGTTNASVTISNAAVIEWMGTNGVTDAARDNFEDPANWNLGRLPTSADTVRFSSSANVSVYPDVAKSVTGDVFQFKSKSWWEIRNTKMVIGSRYEVEAGRSNFVGYSSSFDIGTRDVVINVGTGGYLQTTTTFEFKTGPGTVTFQGGGRWQLQGAASVDRVSRWTLDGSELEYWAGTANADFVLTNNGIFETWSGVAFDGVDVSGTGTVRTSSSEYSQITVASYLQPVSLSYDGDFIIDRGSIRANGAGRDVSGHNGNMVLTNGGGIVFDGGNLRVNGLKGSESTNYVYTLNTGTLIIDTTRRNGDFAGAFSTNGTLSLIKVGTGTQILSGANNSYRGFTIVSNGTLLVNGTHTNGGAYTVRSGAILGGVGTIGASVTVEGSLSPGHNGIGTLSVTGGLTWVGAANATAATDWYFDLGAAPNADKVMITGNFAKSAGPAFRFNFGGSTNEGVYTLVEWTGTTGFSDGDFSYINLGNGLKAVFAIVGKTLQVTIGTCTTAPTITLGSQPDECIGATSSSLGYTATANNPTQYRIDYDDTANAAGFLDTAPAALGAAPGSLPISIPLNMPAGIYNATVYVLLPDGCFGTSAFTVTVRDVPAQPGNITQGNPSGSSVCANSVGVTYSIASVPLATSYTWSVPAGATISSGQGATQIVVDWGLAGSGNVTVYASNACGDGDPRSLAVTVRAATPNAPEAQEATDVTTSSFVANWGSVGSFDGYKMDVSTTKGFTSGFILSNETVSGNSRSFTGLSAGQPYYYRLRAFNACGASTNSATITVTLPSVLVAWDVSGLAGGAGSYGASPLAPTTVATSRLTAVGLTRGGGVSQSGTAAARGWGGTGWDGGSEAAAISAGDYATFTITPKTGNYVSIFNVNVFDYRRSADGPTSGKLQYSTNGVDFTDVGGTISYPSSDEGGDSVSSIYLGSVSGLQNVPDNVTVTFRLVNYGASAAGGDWYIYDQGASSDHDFEVLGTFCTNPAAFTVTGGGAYCSGSSGANVGLSDSEPYVTYHLYFDDGLGGGPVLVDTAFGTGGAISFGPQTGVGTYTATAERDSGGCDSSMSGSVNVTVTPTPSAPSITNTTSNASPAQVVLEWSVPGGTVTGYNVKRSSVSGGPYTLLSGGGNVQGTTFTDTTVVIGNTYYYIVTALNGACESVASVEATVVMPTGCPAGIRPIFNRRNDITVTVGNNYPYVLTATDGSSGCPSPAITNSTLPAFITTQDTTGSGTRTRTFTISPTADNQAGVYPIRVTATDAESLATTIVFNVYIGLSVESIYNGNTTPPPSQTNWHIPITDLSVPPSGNATVTFDTTVGVMYDVLTSTNPPGAGGSWSNAVAGMMADGSSEQASVVQSGSMRFYHVVPAGKSATERGVWGIVRPNIPSSLSYMSPPLPGTDRDFGGDFGAELFSELAQGTKVYVMVPGVGIDGDLDVNGDPVDTIDWIILERAQNGWERFGGGALPVLTNGQGFLVFNQGSAASPTFSGPVGNAGTNSIQIVGGSVANPGYNIIGISEGRALPASTAFDGISVVGSYDANAADQVVIYQTDGSFRRLICRPDGTWYDTGRPNNPGETDLLLMPGAAYYYIRRGGTATLEF